MIAFRKRIYDQAEYYFRIRTLNNKGLRQEEKWDITEIMITKHHCPSMTRSYMAAQFDLLDAEKITEIDWNDAWDRFLELIDSKEPLEFLELPF